MHRLPLIRQQTEKEQPPMNDQLTYRALTIAKGDSGAPSTLDVEGRSVEAIGATETPVLERDYDTWEVYPTVLLMSGCQIPPNRQLPLLDTHSRYSTASVIGSYRDMRIENNQLLGRAVFSTAEEAEGPWLKTMEGHLTDYSVARKDLEATIIPANQTGLIDGRTFQGPVKVVTKWIPKEMSSCPIGADENAKARAATAQPEKQAKENVNMSTETQNRGLSAETTQPQTPAVDLAAVRAEAVKAEYERMSEIDAMCSRADVPADKKAELIKPGVTVDAARAAVMEIILDRSAAQNPGHRTTGQTDQLRAEQTRFEMGADERDKFRSAAEDGLLIRCGKAPEKVADGARDFAGFSLRELARESLRMSGQSQGGDVMAMVGRALTTSDFPLILANIANKSLFAGYDAASETWGKWCGTGSVNDFKTNTIVRAGEMADLDQIREDDEYKYGSRSEAQEQFAIATYGKLFNISRQAIINDDLGALTDIPAAHGEAAGRKIGDIAYAVLTANSAMGDGTALFHANHTNLGTAGVIGTTTMAEAVKLMALQKDIGGKRRLNIAPKYLITSPALAQAAQTFFGSSMIGTQANPNQVNIYAGLVELVFEPRLFDDSATAWYLAGNKGKTVNVYFLNGNQTPYMETRQGWSVDGVEYKVRIDAGAKAVDWKSLFKNAGA
jgi:hypothetical protein